MSSFSCTLIEIHKFYRPVTKTTKQVSGFFFGLRREYIASAAGGTVQNRLSTGK